MKDIKKQAQETITETQNIFKNVEHFVQAASLTIVVAFGGWAVTKVPMHNILRNIILGSLTVMGIRMAYGWLQFFNFKRS